MALIVPTRFLYGETFHQRVARLYAIDVEPFEFDFLRPLSDEP